MTLHAPQTLPDDYDAVHAAVMETARGRWFLEEYGKRNRNADTSVLLAAIERIEAALRSQDTTPAPSRAPAPQPPAPMSTHALHELRDAIMLTKDSLPAVDPEGRIAFRPDFGRIPAGIAAAADRMRASVEQVQETAWFLRERAEQERGALKDALETRCNELETQARDLSAACAQLDQMSESAAMIAALLTEIETRFEQMIAAEAARPARGMAVKTPVIEKPGAATAEQIVPPPAAMTFETPLVMLKEVPQAGGPAFVDLPPVETPVAARPTEVDPISAAPEPEAAPPPGEPEAESVPLSQMEAAAPDAPPAPAPVIVARAAADPEPVTEAVTQAGPASEPWPLIMRDIANMAAPAPQPPAPAAQAMPAMQPGVRSKSAPAAVKPDWMDKLAPMVRARNAPDPGPAAKISFDFDDEPTAIAMPNPARRETPGSDLVPPPVRPEPAAAPQAVQPEAVAPDSPGPAEIARPDVAKADIARPDVTPIPLVMRFEIPSPPIAKPATAPVAEAIMPELEQPPAAPAPVFRTTVLLPDEKPSDDPAAYLFDRMPDVSLPEPPAPPLVVNGNGAHVPAAEPAKVATPADALAPIMALSDEEKIALFS